MRTPASQDRESQVLLETVELLGFDPVAVAGALQGSDAALLIGALMRCEVTLVPGRLVAESPHDEAAQSILDAKAIYDDVRSPAVRALCKRKA